MPSKEEIKKAKEMLSNPQKEDLIEIIRIFKRNGIENYCITKNETIETLLQYIDQLEQENINFKMVLDDGLDKNKKYCFNEDGNTGKCLGYSNVDDDEPCEYCKTCEALSIKGDD